MKVKIKCIQILCILALTLLQVSGHSDNQFTSEFTTFDLQALLNIGNDADLPVSRQLQEQDFSQIRQNLDNVAASPAGGASISAENFLRAVDLLLKKHGLSKAHVANDITIPTLPQLEISRFCFFDLVKFVNGLTNGETWAIKMLDAIGKIPNGITAGNLLWLGRYDMCRSVHAGSFGGAPFDANYCLATVGPFLTGFCMPFNCTADDLTYILSLAISEILPDETEDAHERMPFVIAVNVSGTVCKEDLGDLSTGEIIAIMWTTVLVALVVAGTGFDAAVYYFYAKPDRGKRHGFKKKKVEPLAISAAVANATKVKFDTTPADVSKIPTAVDNKAYEDDDSTQQMDESPSESAATSTDLPPTIYQLQKLTRAMSIAEVEEIKRDIVMMHLREPVPQKTSLEVRSFIQAFSLVTNFKYVFRCQPGPDNFPEITGLRVFSLLWVILMHTHLYTVAAIDNYIGLYEKVDELMFQMIVNGNFAIDTFFFISGFVVCFWTIKKLRERGDWGNKRFWLFHFYLHRFTRILPLYAWCVLLFTTLFFRVADGPLFTFPEASPELCVKYWWTNMIFLNNFIPEQKGDRCLGWTWFIAANMQMYVISPLFILPLYKSWKIGTPIIIAGVVASMVTTGILTINYGLPATYIGGSSLNTTDMGIDYIYTKPYTRIQPFLIGILLGYYFAGRINRKLKINIFIVITGWLATLAIYLFVMFGLVDHYKTFLDPYAKSETVKAFYNSTSRFAWSLAVGWTIFACVTGNGGVITSILRWKAWIPLARISFAAYILHPALMYLYWLQLSVPTHYADWTMIYMYASFIVLSLSVSLGIALLTEFPYTSLERFVRGYWPMDKGAMRPQ